MSPSTPQPVSAVRLGLRESLAQFSLLVVVNARLALNLRVLEDAATGGREMARVRPPR